MRLVIIATLLALPWAVSAQHRFTGLLGAEAWNNPETPAHAYLQLTYDYNDLPADAVFRFTYHTDTLQLEYGNVHLGGGVTADVRLKGEALLAGLLTDHYVDGRADPSRGFYASFAEGTAGLNAPLGGRASMRLEITGTRWFFAEKDTDPAYVLPPESWVVSPRLSYTWWGLKDDAAWRDPHRGFARHRGFAIGVTAGLDVRDQVGPWGAPDTRNRPEQVMVLGRQWIRAGWQAHRFFRLQFEEQAAFGAGQDDINRVRVGGLNPYVAPLAGAPWASYLPDAMVANALSGHIKVAGDFELAPVVHAVVLNDPHRTGDNSEVDTLFGAGLLLDWRYESWQFDARVGWSPSVSDASGEAAWTALLSAGWGSGG